MHVQALLSHPKTDPNRRAAKGGTALFLAAIRVEHEAILTLLSRRDVDVNLADNGGVTPLLAVVKTARKHPNVSRCVCSILKLRPEANAVAKDPAGWQALHHSVYRNASGAVRCLLARPNIDINARAEITGTLLTKAY